MGRIKIIAGHYGSGKTEVAVSMAMDLAAKGEKVALGDLDVINPYFRSRERHEIMEEKGIWVLSSTLGHSVTLDLPAINSEIKIPISDPQYQCILDVGGDPSGAKALVNFVEDIQKQDYEMLYVLNINRPETSTAKKAYGYLRNIEATTGVNFTGIISNTHMIWDTTLEDVKRGIVVAKELSKHSGVPLSYIAATNTLLDQIECEKGWKKVPIGMFMRDEWM